MVVTIAEKAKEQKETSQGEALEQKAMLKLCPWLTVEACGVALVYGQQW